MQTLYYLLNNAYQASSALSLYRKTGGVFLVKNLKLRLQLKKYLRGISQPFGQRTLFNIPVVKNVDINQPLKQEGIFIALANVPVQCSSSKSKVIFLGHGTGDKPYQGGQALRLLEANNYHFISGPKHLAKLQDIKAAIPKERLIKIGNMRFDDYVNDWSDKKKVYTQLGIKEPYRKNILYAPTWKWGNGTLLKYGHLFCKTLSKRFNLIIRPHAHDRMHIPKMRRWARKEGLTHVYFSKSSDIIRQDIMAVFKISDLMISDTSSIIYEYLITSKPQIIIKTDYDHLHAMPQSMDINSIAKQFDGTQNIEALVQKTLEKHPEHLHEYQEMLANTFYFNDGQSTRRGIDFIQSISF